MSCMNLKKDNHNCPMPKLKNHQIFAVKSPERIYLKMEAENLIHRTIGRYIFSGHLTSYDSAPGVIYCHK